MKIFDAKILDKPRTLVRGESWTSKKPNKPRLSSRGDTPGFFDRQGQLGKIITSFPVIFLIFFIVGAYLIIVGFFVIKGPDVPEVIDGVDVNDFLLKEINVNVKKILLIDGLIKLENGEIERDVLYEEVKKFIKEKNNVIMLAKGESFEPGRLTGGAGRNNFIVFYDNGAYSPNLGSYSSNFAEYRNKGLLKRTFFDVRTGGNVKRIYFEYYYGRKYE